MKRDDAKQKETRLQRLDKEINRNPLSHLLLVLAILLSIYGLGELFIDESWGMALILILISSIISFMTRSNKKLQSKCRHKLCCQICGKEVR